jgi:hypothetical protein
MADDRTLAITGSPLQALMASMIILASNTMGSPERRKEVLEIDGLVIGRFPLHPPGLPYLL